MARITQIQVRRDTASNWNTQNPTLATGELGYVTTGTNAGLIKIGDGSTLWTSLSYITDASKISGTTLSTSVTTATGITSVGTLGALSVTGTVSAGTFSGNGAAITALNAGNISTGTLATAQGGTGATTAALARTALSAAGSGANSDITSITGLTTMLSPAQGGTGVNNSAANTITVSGGAVTMPQPGQVLPVLYQAHTSDYTMVASAAAIATTARPTIFPKAASLAADTLYEIEAEIFVNIVNNNATTQFAFGYTYTGTYADNGMNGAYGASNATSGASTLMQYSLSSNTSATVMSVYGPYQYTGTVDDNSSFGASITATNSSGVFTNTQNQRFLLKGLIRTKTAGNLNITIRGKGNGFNAMTALAGTYVKLIPIAPANSGVVTTTASVTAASSSGGTITYTAANTFTAGQIVTITGLTAGQLNLAGQTISSATSTQFAVVNSATGSITAQTGTATIGSGVVSLGTWV